MSICFSRILVVFETPLFQHPFLGPIIGESFEKNLGSAWFPSLSTFLWKFQQKNMNAQLFYWSAAQPVRVRFCRAAENPRRTAILLIWNVKGHTRITHWSRGHRIGFSHHFEQFCRLDWTCKTHFGLVVPCNFKHTPVCFQQRQK